MFQYRGALLQENQCTHHSAGTSRQPIKVYATSQRGARRAPAIPIHRVVTGAAPSIYQCHHPLSQGIVYRYFDNSRFRQCIANGRNRIERIGEILFEQSLRG